MQTVTKLLDTFQPTHYRLTLDLRREERTFSGTVTITGTLALASPTIALHSKDLHITKTMVNGTPVRTASGENDELMLEADGIFTPGEYTLELTFSGTITDAMHGIYPCYYEYEGKKKELLATQFESHHAREVFPCIDEPAAKATFDLALVTEKDITVLGNMPVKTQTVRDQRLHTAFETTPRMSTYLLAFVAGELQKASAVSKSGVEVNIWATPAQPAESLSFPLDVATRALDFFSDYFGTPYPLPKADHVALPDFSAGAMENWGLITYREVCLLVDPKKTSTRTKQYAATVISHELSHQWFGNLVTMQWWDDLWLNESFASLMEYIAVDHLFPEWDIWSDFTSSESLPALRRDSLPGVQAIRTDVNHPDEISTLFDPAIVYAKGARTLSMLRSYIGDAAFQQGLRAYFAAHAYQNTIGSNLWQVLGAAAEKDISSFMQQWINQSGFPVVSAMLHDDSLELTQHQFLIGQEPDENKLWPIPLGANHPELPELLDTKTLHAPYKPDHFLKLNQNDTAHFITHYDTTLQQQLIDALKAGKLNITDRIQILHEATLLPRANIGSTADVISLLTAYTHEKTEPVWSIVALALSDLRKFVDPDTTAEKGLQNLSYRLAQQNYDRLGWKPLANEPESDALLRATVLSAVLYSERPAAIEAALEHYNKHRTDIAALPSDTRSLILSAAVRFAPDKDNVVAELIELYKSTGSPDIQLDITHALTATRQEATITQLLALMKDTKIIRAQDTARWFAYLLGNRYARQLTWQWLQDNWPWIEQTFSGDKSYDTFPRYAGSILATAQHLQEYQQFFIPLQKIPALARAIEIGVTDIKSRVAWLDRDTHDVRTALEALAS